MTDTKSIPLNQLVAWNGNVRKTAGADTALAELAASIAAHGLLQSLVVRRHKGDKFAVVAGGRRLAALQSLAESDRIANDHAVPCQVLADEIDATEISLAENAVREEMHPADEFEAFLALAVKGLPSADIAARFGVSESVVEKRLKLARVSPLLLQAYREGETTLECLMAFAVTDDHKAQERLWKSAPAWLRESAHQIRHSLTEAEIDATDRRVKFVTLKAYEKAGGSVRRDLFSESAAGIFIDNLDLLDQLVSAKLERAASSLRKEGWKWIETRHAHDSSEWSKCERIFPEPKPLPSKLAKELAALEAEFIQLRDQWDANEDDDAEYPDRLRELDDRIDEIRDGQDEAWTPEQLAIGGAVVTIGYNGKADIERGYVLPADQSARSAKAKTDADGTVTEAAESSGLSAALVENLTRHRSAAISAELLSRPDVALATVVHNLTQRVLYDGYSSETCLELWAEPQSVRDIGGSKAFLATEQARTSWGDRIPGNPDALFVWCLEQDQTVLLDLLAFCAASTVNAVRAKADKPDAERFAHADALASTLNLDMAAWFTPDRRELLREDRQDRHPRCPARDQRRHRAGMGQGEKSRPRRHRRA